MTTIIDGTAGITFPDVSTQATAGLPLTGGTVTGGVNLATSSGNVGIGTASPSFKVQVTAPVVNAGVSVGQLITNAGTGNAGSAIGLGYNTGNGYYAQVAGVYDGTGSAFTVGTSALGVATTERMRIDSSGNLGIGTTTPATGLEVSNANLATALFTNPTTSGATTGGGIGFKVYNGTSVAQNGSIFATSSTWSYGTYSANQLNISANGAGGVRIATATAPIVFNTGDASNSGVSAERMRIDSSGNLLVGTTIPDPTGDAFSFQPANKYGTYSHITGTSTGTGYVYFRYAGTSIGSIAQNGTTAVLYNTTSDYRLKTDVTPLANGLSTIQALNPVSFTWVDGRPDDGFLAHELQTVIPNCVTGEKDAVNEDGTPKYQQMDNSGVIPFLVKAIQEQQALITIMQDRLTKAGL
jgi:hypothetical protein